MPAIVCLCLSFLLFPGCLGTTISGSGKIETQSLAIDGFTKVKVGSEFEVEITKADKFSVELSIDDNLKDYVEVAKRGDVLVIGQKSGKNVSFRHCTLKAKIFMPSLDSLELSGAAEGKLSGFVSDQLSLDLSGAASLRGSLEAKRLEIDLSGASELQLSGGAQQMDLDSSGASEATLESFSAIDAVLDLSGASEADVLVTGNLDASASGASTVRYRGNPKLGAVHTSGASHLKQL